MLDKGAAKGNYLEASASCLFVYTLAKVVRQGPWEQLPEKLAPNMRVDIQPELVS